MRKPCEYLAAAMANLRGGPLSGLSETLRHGERSAAVTRVGMARLGGDGLSESEVPENCRVLALAADFPALRVGEAVELGASLRVVTSCNTGPVNVLFTVGLSAPFDNCRAAYSGTRRESGALRSFNHPLDVLLLESGSAEPPSYALAPSAATAYLAAIRAGDWPEASYPCAADVMEVSPGGIPFVLKVSTVTRADGWFILKCRTRD